jgi:hypothetical protein
VAFYGAVYSGNIPVHCHTLITSDRAVNCMNTTFYHSILSHFDPHVYGFQAPDLAIFSDPDPAVHCAGAAPDRAIIADSNAAVDSFRAMVYGLTIPDMDTFIDAYIAAGKDQTHAYNQYKNINTT